MMKKNSSGCKSPKASMKATKSTNVTLSRGVWHARPRRRFSILSGVAGINLRKTIRYAGKNYDPLHSADFATGRGGFLQLLSASLPSCCRFHPARVNRRFSQLRRPMLPSPYSCRLGLWGHSLSRPHLRSLSLRPNGSPSSQG
jgi:hypothetical protein